MGSFVFIPRHPQKYAGDAARIVARSKWEIAYMNALDNSNLVLKWLSEPKNLSITYISPINKKLKTYWPDFLVQYINGDIDIVEIKPMKESSPSKAVNLYDKLMLAQNIAKWQAAEKLAQKIGGRFRLVTEDQLFKNTSNKRGNKK